MFSIREFIMNTLKGMVGNYPDFQVREYALNWYSKGKLTEDDLAEIEEFISPVVEEVIEGEGLEEGDSEDIVGEVEGEE